VYNNETSTLGTDSWKLQLPDSNLGKLELALLGSKRGRWEPEQPARI
jgi:hypothetical protein